MNYKLKTVDAETLLSTPMSKTMFIVAGLIPQGVNDLSISFVHFNFIYNYRTKVDRFQYGYSYF